MTTPTAAAPAPADPVTIEFHGRTMPVVTVSQEQLALLIEAQEWFRRRRRDLDAMAGRPAGTADAQGEQILNQGFKHVGRLQTILQHLFVDPEDWDEICQGMAERTIPWQDVADLPAKILAAHRIATEGEPGNREAKRAAAKRGRRAA